MSGFSLRKRARVCYYEPEEPPFDEFVFCLECRDYVYEYCSIHGPLLVIPDDKVPAETGLPAFVPRAALSIPSVFLHIAYSYIPEAGLGVFSTLTLPAGVRFGPYRGQRVKSAGDSNYAWQIYDRNHKPLHIVDARDANNSNWMRYVNCARHHAEQNLVAFQYQGQLYYRTVKIVPRFTELLVFYGSQFANWLGVDLRGYNKPCPCPGCQARLTNKNELPKPSKRQARIEERKENNTEKKTSKRSRVEKLHETSTSPQVQRPIDMNIQEVIHEQPINTVTDKTDSNATNFKCDQCGKDFDMKSDLEKHIQTHELMKKSMNQGASKHYVCKKCSCTLETKLLLLEHAKGQARLTNKNELPKPSKRQARVEERKDKNTEKKASKRSRIEKLQETSTSPQVEPPIDMNIQEVIHEQPVVNVSQVTDKTDFNATYFKCDQCGKDFDMKADLEKHIQTHELMKKSMNQGASKHYICKKCSCTLETKLLLLEHAKSQHAVEYFACTECAYTTCLKGSLQRHLRTHTGERPFKCNQCNSAFTQSSNLKTHLKTHTGEKPYKCNQCTSAFTQSGDLKRHLRTHTGEKPYKCNQCSSAFTMSGDLKRHLRTHTGEKPYKCNQCSSAFSMSGDLKTHLRTHTGEKPYKCNQCSSAFTQSRNLKRHLRTHTGEKPYKCNQCSSAFTQSGNLKKHLRTHGEKP